MKNFPLLPAILGLLLPAVAHAQVSFGAQQVAGPLVGFFTGTTGVIGLNDLALLLLTRVWLLIGVAATYNIVRAGIRLINSQEEDKLTKARRTIGSSIVSVMAFYLVPRIVVAVYSANGPGNTFMTPAGVDAGATVLASELYGIIRWVEVIIIPLAIGLIVFSGLKAILSFGKEDGPAALRKEVFAVVAGILLLMVDPFIKATLGIPNLGLPGVPSTAPLFLRGIEIVNKLMLMLALVAVVIVVYAGIRMIISVGSEDDTTKAKQLLVRAIIGMAVLFISYALAALAIQIVGV